MEKIIYQKLFRFKMDVPAWSVAASGDKLPLQGKNCFGGWIFRQLWERKNIFISFFARQSWRTDLAERR
jgi:hypothetical protein